MKKELKDKVSTQVVVRSLKAKARSKFKQLAKVTKIKTNKDYELVSATISTLSAIGKEAEAQLGTIINPLQESIRLTKTSIANSVAVFEPFLREVQTAKDNAKVIMLDYQNLLEEKKAKVLTEVASGKITDMAAAVAKAESFTVIGTGTKNVKRWTAVCKDVAKTPREYMVPNESAIKEALKAGKKVAGWEWKQIKSVSI
jgi:hypothetical protein